MTTWDIDFSMRVDMADHDLIRALAEAKTLARAIKDIPLAPGARTRFDALNVMRWARGTTGIEGSELTEDEVMAVLAAEEGSGLPPGPPQEHERPGILGVPGIRGVRNAADLMDFVETAIAIDPSASLNEDLIRDFHRRLTSGVRHQGNVPGHYRSHPVTTLSYRPPDHSSEIRSLMREFIDWFNGGPPKDWDPIVQALVAHFYVMSIHPFGDGNGRTARAVESFLLCKTGVSVRRFCSLANFYYQNRAEYAETLDRVRFETAPDLTPFVRFAVYGLVSELGNVHRDVMEEVRLISYRDHARELIEKAGKLGSPVGNRLLGFILMRQNRPVSLKEVRRGLHPISRLYKDVGLKTLSRDVKLLIDLHLVKVVGDWLTFDLGVLDPPTSPSAAFQASIPGFS
jgi:Fic family protein